MARRQTAVAEAAPDHAFLLRRAARRLGRDFDLDRRLWLKYGADVDMLTIRFKEHARPTRSKSDPADGVIYNYEGSRLVSVEILDISE
jgi:hypothetical protein